MFSGGCRCCFHSRRETSPPTSPASQGVVRHRRLRLRQGDRDTRGAESAVARCRPRSPDTCGAAGPRQVPALGCGPGRCRRVRPNRCCRCRRRLVPRMIPLTRPVSPTCGSPWAAHRLGRCSGGHGVDALGGYATSRQLPPLPVDAHVHQVRAPQAMGRRLRGSGRSRFRGCRRRGRCGRCAGGTASAYGREPKPPTTRTGISYSASQPVSTRRRVSSSGPACTTGSWPWVNCLRTGPDHEHRRHLRAQDVQRARSLRSPAAILSPPPARAAGGHT